MMIDKGLRELYEIGVTHIRYPGGAVHKILPVIMGGAERSATQLSASKRQKMPGRERLQHCKNAFTMTGKNSTNYY